MTIDNEIALRRSTDRSINDLEKDIERSKDYIAELLTFKNKLEGQRTVLAGVSLIIVLGSYYYTFIHTQESFQNHNNIIQEHRLLKEKVARQEIQITRIDERYISLTGQLTALNSRLSQLIDIINEERRARNKNLGHQPDIDLDGG